MAGASKGRNRNDKYKPSASPQRSVPGSSSGDTSTSGKVTQSAKSHSPSRSQRSSGSRRDAAGYDGNRDPNEERDPTKSKVLIDIPKNLDLGAAAWSSVRDLQVSGLPPRPALSKMGQPCKIALNTFEVLSLPTMPVFQFDVHFGSGNEKRGLIRKLWESKAVKAALGPGFIFDGNKLAWSMKTLTRDINITVDLDAEEGREVKAGGKENRHRFVIRQTNSVKFNALLGYLEGKCGFDNSVLESINFLDHVLREHPTSQFTAIRRSFFRRGDQRFLLGNAVEAFKGVYQSMRIVHNMARKACLSINVDVANGTFWTENLMHISALQLCNSKDVHDLIAGLRTGGENGRQGKAMKKFRKLHVTAKHRGGKEDDYVIERVVFKNAREHKFEKDGRMVSLYDYFALTYNVRLMHPELPLVKMTRGQNTLVPMELLKIKQNQRYQFKLDERQTSQMIKFAATPPPERWSSIEHGLRILNWTADPVLDAFKVKISQNRTNVEARLLPAPKVQFGAGEARPGTSGRWDLKGKKFLLTPGAPLTSWGVCVIPGKYGPKPDKTVVENFIREFIKIYQSHGGKIENRQPSMTLAHGTDVGQWVTTTWNATGNQSGKRPDILVFILPDKDSVAYGRIKRSAECRYGVVSQCMQYQHVQKCQPQYISNVCMKFNAKLGGATCRAIGTKSAGEWGHFTVPTAVIGADVSHAAPGSQAASMAAITMSMDKLGMRYAAACETNGFRVEMISTDSINSIVTPLMDHWSKQVGSGRFPQRIIYMRDGVSEGQYAQVLNDEVKDMKRLMKKFDPKLEVQFVVLVSGKRHHIRFFPERGDRNGNPFPGTLVETGVTHPYENDFYLCAHAAIKGTARPMHYHVLLNEAKMSNDELQTLLYEQSYQYIRATTPVSQHPAIYYAHIASNRAIPHDEAWGTGGPTTSTPPSAPPRERSGSQGGSGPRPGSSGTGEPGEYKALMPMPNQGNIRTSMWFI
ncbi:Piwi domain-containing protein [Neohortaea acidophila]|uniref:Piwi domain-containing protein n=1 Tax=Neohortaea acidophila TaxID=245834 RepID=A0A6A6PNX2_9PEZI|nr:Piwi domain-containing protein [Neohortaea acidophila]KAF2481788.1 Piwi domain-containing protein [Neohortaea acidophila]